MTPRARHGAPLRAALRDDQGAVMVMGLFLGLAAIAALWCLIGIADAVIARDRSQEAADSVAYASAVVHARGMNFICLINIVALAMTMLYVTLSVLDVLLSTVLLLTGIKEFLSINWCGYHYVTWLARVTVSWCSIAKVVEPIELKIYKADKKVFEKLTSWGPPLFKAQSFAASAVPFLALAAGADAGAEYGRLGIAYSHSLWPGGGAPRRLNFLRPLLNRIPGSVRVIGDEPTNVVQDRRIGLPVDAEPAYNLCIRGVRFGLEFLKNLPGSASFGGLTWSEWAQGEPTSFIFYWMFQLAGETTRIFFCNDKKPYPAFTDIIGQRNNDQGIPQAVVVAQKATIRAEFWIGLLGIPDGAHDKFYFEKDEFWRITDDALGQYRDSADGYWVGPKRIIAYAYNGNDWFQVWGFARSFDDEDQADAKVSIPARVFGRAPAAPDPGLLERVKTGWFHAGAEYYFDCDTVWQSSSCNKGAAAAYQMNWRARMRRMHWPNPANTLFEMFLDNFLMGSGFKNFLKGRFANLPQARQEALIKSIRNETLKIMNHRLFTGDTTVDAYYH